MKIRFNMLARVVVKDQITLEFFLESQFNAITKTSFSTWINAVGQMEKSKQTLKEKLTWLFKLDSDNFWICWTCWVQDLRRMVKVAIVGWPHPDAWSSVDISLYSMLYEKNWTDLFIDKVFCIKWSSCGLSYSWEHFWKPRQCRIEV